MFKALAHIFVQLGQSKLRNDALDNSMLCDMLHEAVSSTLGSGLGPSTITVDSVLAEQQKAIAKGRIQELQDSGESTCVALIRMMSTNMQMLLKDHFKQKRPQMKQQSAKGSNQFDVTPKKLAAASPMPILSGNLDLTQ
jgi:hypothetical protein